MSTEDGRSGLALFVGRRIGEIAGERSLAEIAKDAGFKSTTMLSMVVAGRAKLPIDRVGAMARALGVETRPLMVLALSQFFREDVVEMILHAGEDDRVARLSTLASATAVGLGVEIVTARRTVEEAKHHILDLDAKLEKVFDRLRTSEAALDQFLGELNDLKGR